MAEEYAICLQGICNSFGRQEIHKNLELKVKQGEILGLIGGSGSGKSVLLNSILGLKTPQAGEIAIMDYKLNCQNPKGWDEVRAHWGVLFQDGALFSSLTVSENIQVPLKKFARINSELMSEIVSLKLQLVGLSVDTATKYPSELSGGMRKRVGLARALALDPSILLLDEPTAGLDPIAAASFDNLIKTLSKSLGLTVLMITHDIDSLYNVCDRVAVLADKKIIATGTIPELLKIPHPWIQEYFMGIRGKRMAN